MPTTCKRRPGEGGAAGTSLAGDIRSSSTALDGLSTGSDRLPVLAAEIAIDLIWVGDRLRGIDEHQRAVQREAERGEKISEGALALINGTRLDKGTYLDSLKKVPAQEQLAKVKQDLAAPKRTRRLGTTAIRPELDEAAEAENAIIDLLVRRLGSDLSVFTQLFKLIVIWRFERKLAAAVKGRP